MRASTFPRKGGRKAPSRVAFLSDFQSEFSLCQSTGYQVRGEAVANLRRERVIAPRPAKPISNIAQVAAFGGPPAAKVNCEGRPVAKNTRDVGGSRSPVDTRARE